MSQPKKGLRRRREALPHPNSALTYDEGVAMARPHLAQQLRGDRKPTPPEVAELERAQQAKDWRALDALTRTIDQRHAAEARAAREAEDDRESAIFSYMLRSGVEVPLTPDRTWRPHPAFVEARGTREPLERLRQEEQKTGAVRIFYTGERAHWLVTKAQTDPLAWEAACRVTRHLLEQNKPLPPSLARLAANAFTGRQTRPARPGRSTRHHRDQVLAQAVELLVLAGYRPTTRFAGSLPQSACDAVAAAASDLGLHVSYDVVKKAWGRARGAADIGEKPPSNK